jgi:hypothetical protein
MGLKKVCGTRRIALVGVTHSLPRHYYTLAVECGKELFSTIRNLNTIADL